MSESAKSRVIGLAVDDSENAKHAFFWYLEHVKQEGDTIVLIHCPEVPSLPSFTFTSGIAPPVTEWQSALAEIQRRTNELGQAYAAKCREANVKFKLTGESVRNPGEGIIAAAAACECEMIIMGSRGLGQVKRVLLGSVSDYVIHHSVVPVLVVPNKQH